MGSKLPLVWVVEIREPNDTWHPANTLSLSPAVYLTRAEARRALHNREVGAHPDDLRLRKYVGAD